MTTPDEFSESGAPIYRHQAESRPIEPATGDDSNIERITDHITKYIGVPATVFHELISDRVHLDVHFVEPAPGREYHTLITSGMSDRPMTVPEGLEQLRFAEMLLCLPADWPVNEQAFKDSRHYWPIRWLKTLARMPHQYDTWLHTGHTVPNGDPPQPYADNTELCCALILQPVLFGEGFPTLEISPEKTIHFLTFIPIYREEMDFKLENGLDALIDRLADIGVTELLDLDRENVCR